MQEKHWRNLATIVTIFGFIATGIAAVVVLQVTIAKGVEPTLQAAVIKNAEQDCEISKIKTQQAVNDEQHKQMLSLLKEIKRSLPQ